MNDEEKEKSYEIRVAATPKEATRLTIDTVRHHLNTWLAPSVGYPDLLKNMPGVRSNPKALDYIGDIKKLVD